MEKYSTGRLVWIDWMKTLAMFFIIAGHCWVPGNKFIYVFSVPCFFILSGFLSKREDDKYLFWEKLLWNLVVPMTLFFAINILVQFAVQLVKGTFEFKFLYQAPLLALVGMQGQNYAAGGLKAMWFVYTLILCKILLQYTPIKHQKMSLALLSCVFILVAWWLHSRGIVLYNSIVNVLLAMPFFTIGYYMRPLKEYLSMLPMMWMPLLVVFGIVGVYLCGQFNDIVMLYRCSYGSNLLLCFVGALCGTVGIYAISMMLKRYIADYVSVIGGGTLVILGLHFVIIQVVNQFVAIPGIWRYAESLVILVAFIPVIKFVERHIPILYGKLRKNSVL